MLLLICACLVAIVVLVACKTRGGTEKSYTSQPLITAVSDSFEWDKAEPRPIRPFKGKKIYKINMGISSLAPTPEDWLLIDKTYKKHVTLRKQITEQNPKHTIYVHNSRQAHDAVKEFYDKAIYYYVARYPKYFVNKEGHVYNTITELFLPRSQDASPQDLLLALAANMEEDFLILTKDNPQDPNEEYKLRATLNGFPSGFDPAEGFDKPISYIHSQVPQYVSKLKFSMAKFFNRLEPSDLWVRHNWTVQTHALQFSLSKDHENAGEKKIKLTRADLDPDAGAFLRVERQILSRLPRLRANFMTVRTYLTPLRQIKDEGLGEEICDGIDGMPADVSLYKRMEEWGDAVKDYMRE